MIADAVARERALTAGSVIGVAGGACGGDILFHEGVQSAASRR